MKKMKQRVKAKARKLVASILVAAMAVAIVPKIAGNNIVLAAGTKNDENTCLGTSKMASPATPTADSEWSGSKVYFGTYDDEPILFRVLAPNTSAYGGSTLFLDSDETLFRAYFDNSSPYSNSWVDSDIRAKLNGSFLKGFTDLEKAAIAMSSGTGGFSSYAAGSYSEYRYISPVSVNDKVFLLDATEVTNPAYGYAADEGWDKPDDVAWTDFSFNYHHTVTTRIKGGSSAFWWLRSPLKDDSYCAGSVYDRGSLDFSHGRTNGVAPALNINQSSIIFSSLISGSFNTVGAEYKLTIKDPDLDIAVPDGQQVAVSGTTVTIPYKIKGANAGTATRASILITDKKWDASGATIKLYNALGTNKDTSGTFTLPSDLDLSGWGTDYHIYILAEDINDGHDGKDTDYASAPVELASPIAATTYTVTVNSGSADVTTAAQGATVTLTADAASAGKEFDKWSVDSGTITLEDVSSATTTFTMPAEDVKVTAKYKDIVVTAISIATPGKTAYTVGDSLDVSGMEIKVDYSDGSSKTIPVTAAMVSGFDSSAAAASQTLTITYEGKTTTYNVSISAVTPTTFTVTFNTNGGSAVVSQTVADGSKAVKPDTDPTKEGCTFDGWYQDATFTAAFDFNTAITADTTIYAKWTESTAPGTIYYTVVSGANGTWTEGDIVVTVKRSEDDEHCIDYFTGVKIDDKDLVNRTDYTAVAGSTVVTIKGSTLESLSKGGHTITVVFKDGTAVTSVTLKDKETVTTTAVPSTGETASKHIGAAVLCFVASGALFGVVLFERKKRKCAQ